MLAGCTRNINQILLLLCVFPWPAASAAQNVDWPAYLGGQDSGQYSGLEQITPANAGDLEVAWIYNTGDAAENNRSQIQCNPLIIDGVLYGSSPGFKFFALNAATGEERWVFNPFEDGRRMSGGGVNRGLMYWRDGDEKRLLFTASSDLYALNADTGEPILDFGVDGKVDLKAGLRDGAEKLFVTSNSPGVVYKGLVILGTRVAEALPAAPGDIRAYNVRTGALEWTFHTIPKPGEYGYETWPPDAHERSGGANAWAGMSLDVERGIVYVPTGSAAYDFYGADRAGQNLFANCLLALNAATGERIWHFQFVHHDLWDRDLPAPPNLFTLERDGKRIDAVAQITKSAHVFVFDRETGEPLFPIEEVPVPPSELEGEQAWPTQPLPVKPPPFSRQTMTEDDVTDLSVDSHYYVLDILKRTKTGPQFIPPSREGTLVFPGYDGGGEWGGAAVDPETNILYVNASEMPWLLMMIDPMRGTGGAAAAMGRRAYAKHCLYCHGVDRKGDPLDVYPALEELNKYYSSEEVRTIITEGFGIMPSFGMIGGGQLDSLVNYLMSPPATPEDSAADSDTKPDYVHTGYNRFVDLEGYPAVKPPWGTMNAIDLNKGEILWKVPLGELPELTARGIPPTGTEQYGGPVVTKGGVIFIGATKDEKFRVLDRADGSILWEYKLPAAAYSTPSTYSVDGRQYVVTAAGGGKIGTPSGDAYVAFALPE